MKVPCATDERDLMPIKIGKPKKYSPLEKTRQRNIARFLNTLPKCRAEIRTQTGYGIKGGADIFGCIDGRHFELEVKQPKKQPTILQKNELDRWSDCGAISGRVEDIETTRIIFKNHGVEI